MDVWHYRQNVPESGEAHFPGAGQESWNYISRRELLRLKKEPLRICYLWSGSTWKTEIPDAWVTAVSCLTARCRCCWHFRPHGWIFIRFHLMSPELRTGHLTGRLSTGWISGNAVLFPLEKMYSAALGEVGSRLRCGSRSWRCMRKFWRGMRWHLQNKKWCELVTVHTVSCTRCTATGQYSDGAGIRLLAVRRLSNEPDGYCERPARGEQ